MKTARSQMLHIVGVAWLPRSMGRGPKLQKLEEQHFISQDCIFGNAICNVWHSDDVLHAYSEAHPAECPLVPFFNWNDLQKQCLAAFAGQVCVPFGLLHSFRIVGKSKHVKHCRLLESRVFKRRPLAKCIWFITSKSIDPFPLFSQRQRSCIRPPPPLRGGRVVLYLDYLGKCSPTGYGFSAVLVIIGY